MGSLLQTSCEAYSLKIQRILCLYPLFLCILLLFHLRPYSDQSIQYHVVKIEIGCWSCADPDLTECAFSAMSKPVCLGPRLQQEGSLSPSDPLGHASNDWVIPHWPDPSTAPPPKTDDPEDHSSSTWTSGDSPVPNSSNNYTCPICKTGIVISPRQAKDTVAIPYAFAK